jgi:hypothetical protein
MKLMDLKDGANGLIKKLEKENQNLKKKFSIINKMIGRSFG